MKSRFWLLLVWLVLIAFFTSKVVWAAEIVNINHENGDLSEYGTTVINGGNLSVTADGALVGTNYGMKLMIGNTATMYGSTTVTNTSNVVRYRFYLDLSTFSLPISRQNSMIAIVRNATFVGFVSFYNEGGVMKLRNSILNDVGAPISGYSVISNGQHYIEVKVTRATTNVSADGSAEWWIDGVAQTSITGVDNYDYFGTGPNVFILGAGLYMTVPVGASGTYYLDELVVNNDGEEIGPHNPGPGTFPAGTSYRLEGFAFGGGGANNLGSSNYAAQGHVGQVGSNKSVGNSFNLGGGLAFQRQAGVPGVPTWENDGNFTNKLKLVVNDSGNPSDTQFAVAISDDNFVTTKYVKTADYTVGNDLTINDYQTYVEWGGASGVYVVGLDVGTSYSVKVKAMQGKYTETEWGPETVSGTVEPTLVFDLDVSTSDQETGPPYLMDLGDLNPGSVVTSSSLVWVDIQTNAPAGAEVHMYGKNGGLYSPVANYNIGTTTANLDVLAQGFGVQAVGATQTSGGPLVVISPFDGGGNVVGNSDSTIKTIFRSSFPIVGGRGSFAVKAKSSNQTPAASDYSETMTVVASSNF